MNVQKIREVKADKSLDVMEKRDEKNQSKTLKVSIMSKSNWNMIW